LVALLFRVRFLLEVKVEERHGRTVSRDSLNLPFMRLEVLVMEEASSFSRFWEHFLSGMDVQHDDMAHLLH
jgi:hypothetical protein